MIKNSLILKIITQSAAKATAAQQRSLISLAKVVLDNKIALDNLLGAVSGLCPTPPAVPGLPLLGRFKFNYLRANCLS